MSHASLQRSVLFLPGLRTDRYAKAVGSGADTVCLDLEDAVAPHLKAQARDAVLELIENEERGRSRLALRINPLQSQAGMADMLALARLQKMPEVVILPKVKTSSEVAWLEEMLPSSSPDVEIWAIIETAEALEAAPQIARASPRVSALIFGGADLAAELRCEMEWEPLLYARSRVAHAAAIAGIAAIDVPHLNLNDDEGLRREVVSVRRLGFTGKAAIHPKQVGVVHQGFAPTEHEIAAAKRLLAAFDACQDGVCLLDGRLVELPMVTAARRIITIAATERPSL